MTNRLWTGREPAARSTSDFVYNTLRQAIITQQLPAGSRLVEAKLSKQLNVSITPVREAFARLANQGLLTVFPYKGTYVTILSSEAAEDIYALRRHLEVMAAERGFANLTAEDIRDCQALCQESDAAYDAGDLYGAIHCDILFHERMFRASGSALLLEIWDTIKYRIEYIQSYAKTAMRPRMSVRHRPMLEALQKGNREDFIQALTEHLNSNLRCVNFPKEAQVRYDG